jgi:non-specific protein-tyrosine kinase
MAEPGAGVDAEAYRNVRANLDLLLRKTGYRKILVTSALSVEGKSTTIANLAIALALAGRHVVAVDFDLRRPSLGELFELDRSPGVSDLLLGTAAFDSCLVSVPLEAQPSLDRSEIGSLRVMAAGSPTLNPGELVGGRGAAELLNELSRTADVVLVDTAPALHVSDATALLDAVDAVLLVVRSTLATYDQLQELGQLLSHAPAEPLGFVLTGTPRARTGAHEYLTRYEA